MMRVNVPLHSSRGIFVYSEIIQMPTILESKCTVIKLPRNRNFKAKKQNTIQLIEVLKRN